MILVVYKCIKRDVLTTPDVKKYLFWGYGSVGLEVCAYGQVCGGLEVCANASIHVFNHSRR